MTAIEGMETYAARLASFDVAHPQPKRRASNTKTSKALKWPHKSPSPAQLAKAGFYYKPTVTCPDNAMCFLCKTSLDGWEKDDNPTTEHLKHSPQCGWAINVCIEQRSEDQERVEAHPLSEEMMDARRSTFADRWPHENKRGWTCKTEKMVAAGWYYCPIPESDDFVTCPYCNLSLDGWEPKDNPFDEHSRRSPSCLFFVMTAAQTTKPSRTRKGRASKASRTSKASRASTQSNFSIVSEALSLPDPSTEEGNSLSSMATSTITANPMATKAQTKGLKAKKTRTAAKSAAPTEETRGPTKGTKRTSDEMESEMEAPPPKKRVTRGASTVRKASTASTASLRSRVPASGRQKETRQASASPEDPPALTKSPSPQSSDAENHPPSSRRSPLSFATKYMDLFSPVRTVAKRVPLAASTPARRNIIAGDLLSAFPWTAVDLETIFLDPSLTEGVKGAEADLLTSPEKKMTVEEWIYNNATQGEEKLRRECERVVGIFEAQGVRALRSLEGVGCA